jgi:hypothetical protein
MLPVMDLKAEGSSYLRCEAAPLGEQLLTFQEQHNLSKHGQLLTQIHCHMLAQSNLQQH